jgi:osmotically-inducible protein OsmY
MNHDIGGRDAAQEREAGPQNAELIGDDISHALGHSWFFLPQTIRISVSAGRVTLTGSVRSQRERRMAAAAAWAHEGAVDVENRLVIS